MFFSISLVVTPPRVSIPRESGVTSSSSTSFTSPCRTPPWIAAPMATTSSGFTPLWGSLPKISFTFSCTLGIRLIPPTRITSSMSEALSPASFSANSQGPTVRSTRSSTSASYLARLSLMLRCFGPEASAVINGRLISVSVVVESSIFAFSPSSFRRWRAILSVRRSMPCSLLNSSASQLTIRISKSSPPRNVSPLVDFTSNTPSPISRMETSNVPPPRSNTAIFSSPFLSSP